MIQNFKKATRCQCKNTTNNKICLNKCKTLYIIDDNLYCLNHLRYYRDSYAVKIQSVYRGKRGREILNNIYNRLPDDIQSIISLRIRSEANYKKYLRTIKSIIEKKIFRLEDYIYANRERVYDLCDLYNKYEMLFAYENPHKKIMRKIVINLLETVIDADTNNPIMYYYFDTNLTILFIRMS
ncbi:hypothetical protein PGAG_00108 [Phaeocystis globosa virus 12T]|uniref:Uncharacterized protein n=1 Tax=Phaeocystis globosa virus PgV-16T TaxID=3071227 RepID=A0AC59EWZ9_9VIRU|nr:hypothetical protein PGCG_00148 [Phaeocystis globosa virus]AET72997.1 hypothetical protein PGAG_00108 [Phaeocystis globosa virus 12T]AET73819.1 hypothetical protein PGBG_00111 [Phaeocystis globosa virus 14T]AGM15460.1 hypothetical protein PGCG_00148 [Phaeocystis globosa virus PgV-16T]UYE94190.1 hypothetical protein PGV14T_00148 [Phaeocystis globosa virus]